MANTIQTNGFVITYYGQPSVGVFHNEFRLTGPFMFENEAALHSFKIELAKLIEEVSDGPLDVETLEEQEARHRKYDEVNNFFDERH